jgi:hypothetical protein
MAKTYGQIKSMKTAKIGTIMPWAGDGNTGTLLSNVPTGWILCDGRVYQANRYPLLTSVLGNSYGGTNISGDFPHYSGTIKIPDLTGRVMMDLEPYMLYDSKYYAGQSDAYAKLVDASNQPLIVDDGFTKSIPTLISADTNLVFTISSDISFVGKITGGPGVSNITLTDPSFGTSVYTVGRKLGINHTPTHSHPGSYSSATAGASPPELFEPSPIEVGGSQSGPCATKSWYEGSVKNAEDQPTWCNGKGLITYYDDTTLVTTNQFNEFISTSNRDYSQIPPLTANTAIVYESPSSYTDTISAVPIKTHAQKAWTGYYPRPMEFNGKRNFFGYNTGVIGPTGITDDPEFNPTITVACSITANQTTFQIPAGTSIGTNFDKVVPFMYVSSSLTNQTFITPGTQVVNITQEGDSPNFSYVCELSQNIGGNGTQTVSVQFRHGAWPTTLNTSPSGQDPASNSFSAHNHGSFELLMGPGLKGPVSHPVNDVNKGTVNPLPINGALNILANIANPSLNLVYIIRAF